MSSLSFAAEWRRFSILRVGKLREQLEVEEEEEGKENGQEEEEEVESGEARVKERQPPHTWMTWRWRCEKRSELEPWTVSVMIKDCETMRAGSVHVVMRHAIVEVQCVNVVIGVHIVVLCVLLVVVRVVPINFLSCDTVVHLTRFSKPFFTYVLLYWRYSV